MTHCRSATTPLATTLLRAALVASAAAALLSSATVWAAPPTPTEQAAAARAAKNSTPEAVYRQYRADCLAGRTQQDRATCLKEAGAALAEARRGRLDNGADARTLQQNALLRCQRQKPEDRADCERLARGEGQRSGSVEGGGVIKEIVTVTTGPAPVAASAPQ